MFYGQIAKCKCRKEDKYGVIVIVERNCECLNNKVTALVPFTRPFVPPSASSESGVRLPSMWPRQDFDLNCRQGAVAV